jgi:hypothetical protein
LKNSVPLVAGKRTFIRVHVKSAPGSQGSLISASLTGTNSDPVGATNEKLMPANPGQKVKLLLEPQRAALSDSFYFELPPSWTKAGRLDFRFETSDASVTCKEPDAVSNCGTSVTFQTVRELSIRFINLPFDGDGRTASITDATENRATDELEAAMPVPRLNALYGSLLKPLSSAPKTKDDGSNLLIRLNTIHNNECNPAKGKKYCRDYIMGLLVNAPDDAEFLGLASRPGAQSINYMDEFESPEMQELGHNIGLKHTNYNRQRKLEPDEGTVEEFGIGQPKDGTISTKKEQYDPETIFGFDVNDTGRHGPLKSDGSRFGRIHDPESPDAMSYGWIYSDQRNWFSAYTYRRIFDTLVLRAGLSGSNQEAQAETVPAEGAVLVRGAIPDASVGAPVIDPIYVFNSPGEFSLPEAGSYALRFEDNQGHILATYSFEPAETTNHEGPESSTFNLLLPFTSGTTRITLLQNGQAIASRQASATHPSVTVTSPNGGESLSGTTTIQWSASDSDGDQLSYLLEYSTDAGTNWETLAADLNTNNLEADLSTVPGSSQALFRVTATDGFNTAQDQSDATFNVAKHAPRVRIKSPDDNQLYVAEQTIILSAGAYDVEDGRLGDSNLAWSSNLNGPLGMGNTLAINASLLQEGTHTLTLVGHDSDGEIGNATLTVRIARLRPTFPDALLVEPSGLGFEAPVGSVPSSSQAIAIRNSGDGDLTWNASADQSWIQLNATSGLAPANLSITLSPTGLAAGAYHGQITITSSATNSPQIVSIAFNVIDTVSALSFMESSYTISEGAGSASVTVGRSGDISGIATFNYTTSDSAGSNGCGALNTGVASSRCDYETSVGTLTFAAGETSKTISIPVIDDSYAEGSESFTVTLSNSAGAVLASPTSATVNIADNEIANGANSIDQAGFFVRLHYLDFLNREPDASGLGFWSNQISECGTNATCVDLRRTNVSAAFFLSIEFQETGYLVYRFYKAGYGNITGLPVPLRLNEFLPDTQQIGKGVVVGAGDWQSQLEANKQSFALDFVTRTRFASLYATSMTPAEFVDALFLKANVTPTSADRGLSIGEFSGAPTSANTAARARALRRIAENSTLKTQELNKAFVLMQYFGYLRRNPDDTPDSNFGGFNFWLGKLNEFNGNFIDAEMVRAFIVSAEYKKRFGP